MPEWLALFVFAAWATIIELWVAMEAYLLILRYRMRRGGLL